MFILMGGTGRIGSATARALLAEGQDVTVVTRDEVLRFNEVCLANGDDSVLEHIMDREFVNRSAMPWIP